MNLSYSYAGGFGAGVNVGEGLAAGVSYNEKSGFGVSAGVAADGVSLMYTENFGKGDVRASHGWQAQLGALEVNYDNLSGYSASLRAASTMFGDTNLKMTSSLTWSEQNGFNGSISYNLLTKEQMAKEAAKNAQKDTQKNQNSLLLNILDGLGFNLGVKEGEPTLFDNIQGAFSGAWHQLTNPLETLGNIGNGFSKLGKGLAGLASGAWDSVSGFVSNTYNKMFGPKIYPMLIVGDAGSGVSDGVLSRGGYENINNFEFDETKFHYEVVDENGKTVSLEEYRAGLEKKVRDKLTSDPNYKGDLEKDTKRILQEASQVFMGNLENEWSPTNGKTGTQDAMVLGGINTDYIHVDSSGNARFQSASESEPEGAGMKVIIRRPNSFYFMDTQAVKPGGNGLFPLYQMKFDGTQNQWLGRLVGTVGNQILYPQDGSPVDQVIYPSKPVWAKPGTDGFNSAGNNPWVPMKPPADNRPF